MFQLHILRYKTNSEDFSKKTQLVEIIQHTIPIHHYENMIEEYLKEYELIPDCVLRDDKYKIVIFK